MIHQLLTTEYLFWLVVFFFYVADNTKLVPVDHLMVRQKLTGGYTPLVSLSRYELAGKEIKIPNLFLPFAMVLILKCDPQGTLNTLESTRTSRLLKVMHGQVLALKTISALSFLILLAGPVLTFYFGLLFTLTTLLPIHLALLSCAALLLITRRKKLNLSKEKAVLLILENLLVPAYLSNIVRRVSLKQNFPVDGYLFSLECASPRELAEVKYQIGKKLESLIEEHEADQTGDMIYSSYKTRLGI